MWVYRGLATNKSDKQTDIDVYIAEVIILELIS
jgi:hypothetical protein